MLMAAILAAIVVALVVERIAFRPLRMRGAGRLAPIISAVGASIAIRQGMILIQLALLGNITPRILEVGQILPTEWHWEIAGTNVTAAQVMIVTLSLSAMLTTDWYVQLTRQGKAMRAVAQDTEVAAALGIDVTRVIVRAFVVGAVLAGIGGALIGLYYGQIDQFIGFPAVVKAFIASVIGGIGNIRGAMLGGILLGLVESVAVAFIDASYKDAVAFAILMLVLLVRPSGLLGERQDVYERA
jgi:branched-chain amino acid transport system permease protein